MTTLALVRHGESTWNARGIWTGWENPPLSQKGIGEAKKAGELLKGIEFDIAYVSDLLRSAQTLSEITKILGVEILTVETATLKERNYGDYTGKNKWDIQKELGEKAFRKLRRGWNTPIPNGETLEDVYNRELLYYEKEILPRLKRGENVLICSSGNSIRALVKRVEGISDEDIEDVEIATGEVIIYRIDENGNITSKEIKHSTAI